MAEPFVPSDFVAPVSLVGDDFHLEPLGPQHNERDYEAWTSSSDHIHATPGFEESDWPKPMTPDQNMDDMVRHARDFEERKGFTYTILDGDEVIGCLYIYPHPDERFDARVSSWVRVSRAEMDVPVWRAVSAWVHDAWPFENPYYAARA